MSTTTHGRFKAGMIIVIMTGLVVLGLIAFMALNVARDLRLLESASSDNMQWTISQSEVEFLAMLAEIETTRLDPERDLGEIRNRFDIFYSRISTMTDSNSFSAIRDVESFENSLVSAAAFLERSVSLIDGDDAALRTGLAELSTDAESIRLSMRNLTSTGLMISAREEENRRHEVAITLTQLALITIGLVIMLIIMLFRLMRQKKQIDMRQKAVVQTLSRLNTVIDNSLDGVIVTDVEGCILEFNSAAEDILGHEAHEVIGKSLADVAMSEEQKRRYFSGLRILKQHNDQSIVGFGRIQLEAMRKSGELFPVEISVEEAQTEDENVFITFVRDVSAQVNAANDLVQARDQALASERLKTEFLATMSHEIRTPLNGLLGNLALLKQTEIDNDQMRYVSDMEKSGHLLMRHVSDVLDITQYDSGNLKLRHETVHLDELIGDIVDSQSGRALEQGTTIDWSWIGPPMSWVKTDPDRLLHILQNLIGNAVKFTHDGEITITMEARAARGPQRNVMFRIHDTGIGIEPELGKKVFDDFVTGHTSYDRPVGGTGLGLGIARRFARGMNGDIGLEEREGKGATFWVLLPLEPSSPDRAETQVSAFAPSHSATRKLNVLVVEDNEINRVALCEMLRIAGHTSSVAHDGKDGVRQAEQTRFDLILMDISMPEMDGRAATRAIRSGKGASADVPIVAITANVMAEEQAGFLTDGMNAVLTKPIMPRDLDDVFQRFFAETELVDRGHHGEMRHTLGEDVYQALLAKFVTEGEELLVASLKDNAFSDGDLAMRFHKAAGSASIFGAFELQLIYKNIESELNNRNSRGFQEHVGKLKPVWDETKRKLTE